MPTLATAATARNVLGTSLEPCSLDPVTGFFRDGCCNTDEQDRGLHVVCARMTAEFLEFSRSRGNDLVTPSGKWCRCYGSVAATLSLPMLDRLPHDSHVLQTRGGRFRLDDGRKAVTTRAPKTPWSGPLGSISRRCRH